jgi:peptidoglycan DL-endopeptidase CwlO
VTESLGLERCRCLRPPGLVASYAMPTARGQACGRARVTRASIATGVVTAILVALVTAGTASATSIGQKKQEAQAAQARLTQLQDAAEKKVEAYDLVHQRYENTLAALRENETALKVARQNLKAAQSQLAKTLTADYKSGDQDAIAYMLAARSIGDLVDQVQVLQRTTGVNKTLLTEITKDQKAVQDRQKLLVQQRKQVAADQAKKAAQANSARAAVDREKAYYAGLQASIRKLIQQQQAAAAAAAAAQAAQSGVGSAPPTNLPNPPTSTLGGQAVAIAERYLGVPYVWGGASPSGFDCSGLTMYVYGQLGVSLPHNAAAQYDSLPHVSEGDLEPGDLVFFDGLGHVGIYIGGGEMIHAPHTGTVVQISTLSGGGTYYGAARVPG